MTERILFHGLVARCKDALTKRPKPGYKPQEIKDWFTLLTEELTHLTEAFQESLTCFSEKESELIMLCLQQVCVCLTNIERTIKLEKIERITSNVRQHFWDRIELCLQRLSAITTDGLPTPSLTQCDTLKTGQWMDDSFFDLMDTAIEYLMPFTVYDTLESTSSTESTINSLSKNTVSTNLELRNIVDQILGHALALANVSLTEDKHAISALCQLVLRECLSYQQELQSTNFVQLSENQSMLKLKATSLMKALCNLENYINKTLLRLICICFLDYEKLSIENLRSILINGNSGNTTKLDEFIADFDVNLDRTTQIGIFATTFAPSLKIKITLLSCMASFEALESFLIPAVLAKPYDNTFSNILEQHFNDEVEVFKNVIQEIIDCHAFAECYIENVTDCISSMQECIKKDYLNDILLMGKLLTKHFTCTSNFRNLQDMTSNNSIKYLEKFAIIHQECQAIITCLDQVEPQRVIKRFKILLSILKQFAESLITKHNETTNDNRLPASMTFDTGGTQPTDLQGFESIELKPSTQSFLYGSTRKLNTQSHRRSDANGTLTNISFHIQKRRVSVTQNQHDRMQLKVNRKQSLRTAIFKRNNQTFLGKSATRNENTETVSDIVMFNDLIQQLNISN